MAWVLIVILVSNGNPSGFRIEFGSQKACEVAQSDMYRQSGVQFAGCYRT